MTWAPSYASTDELASFVRIGDTADDVQLALAIAAASRAIDRATSRQFGQAAAPVARYYTMYWPREGAHQPQYGAPYWGPYYAPYAGRNACRWAVDIDDLMTTTGLVVETDTAGDGTYADTVDPATVVPEPLNAAADGVPWKRLTIRSSAAVIVTPLPSAVRVTARYGWTAVPDPIKQACLLQASRLLARRDAPFGVAGSPDAGSEVRLLARLDPDVAVTVAPFRRFWGAV